MKKILWIAVIIVIIGAVVYKVQSTPEDQPELSDEIQIAATIPPIAAIAQEIVGDEATVHSILPPGGSPHTFDVTPSVLKNLSNTKMIFAIGHGLDVWTNDITSALPEQSQVIVVDNNIALIHTTHSHDHHGEEHEDDHHDEEHENNHENEEEYGDEEKVIDPHYWLDPLRAARIGKTIATALATEYPENAAYYNERSEMFSQKMTELHKETTQSLSTLSNRNLIVFHDSWKYLADSFDLEIVGVFEQAAGKEPTPAQLIEIQEHAGEYDIPALFSEPQLSPDVIRPFVQDLGLELRVLDPLGGIEKRMTYEELVRYNANTIIEAYK
ncbi:MAG: metal ABC transporter substrate-binding protein [Patescibacteria group bacterium]